MEKKNEKVDVKLSNFPRCLDKKIDEIKERTGFSRTKIYQVLVEKGLEQKIKLEQKIY